MELLQRARVLEHVVLQMEDPAPHSPGAMQVYQPALAPIQAQASPSCVPPRPLSKLPPFWDYDPEGWLVHISNIFGLHRVYDEECKWQLAVTALSETARKTLRDVVLRPFVPHTFMFELLVHAIRTRLMAPVEDRLREFLHLSDLGSLLPSDKLRHIRATLGSEGLGLVSDALLKSRWLDSLGSLSLRQAVYAHSAVGVTSLDDLALFADGLVRLDSHSSSLPLAGGAAAVSSDQVAKVSTPKSTSKPSRAKSVKQGELCFYHSRFGDKAKRCLPGCKQASKQAADTIAAVGDDVSGTRRLFVFDRSSQQRFLVDTGSDASVIPRRGKFKPQAYRLYGPNGSPIRTYGQTRLELDLGLGRTFIWEFTVADVNSPIIGADLLSKYKLMVDLANKRLIDSTTQLAVSCKLALSSVSSLSSIDNKCPIAHLLSEFSAITRPTAFVGVPKHTVEHHIETKGAPVWSQVRRLSPQKLQAAKAAFEVVYHASGHPLDHQG